MSADKEKVIAEDTKSELSVSTAGTSSKETNSSSSVLAIVVVIALVVAAIALILGIVAVANGRKRVEYNYEDGDGGDTESQTGWVHTYDRPRTFKFTTSFSFPVKTVFMVNEGNTAFEWNNIKATDKIGFVDGWAYDEHCVARAKDQITGSDLAESQIVRYTGRDNLLAGLQNNEVDAIFDNVAAGLAKAASDYGVKIVGPALESCAKDGLSVMTRKDNLLHTWWNPAFEKLKKDRAQWRAICNDLKDEHGHIGGPTPEEFCIDYPAN